MSAGDLDRQAETPPGLLRRLLPRPWTVLWLWLAWLLLNQTVATGHLLLGLLLAVFVARYPAPGKAQLRDPGRRGAWQRPVALARLTGIVFWDIVVANLQVALLILGPQDTLRPRFVWVPIELKRPKSITLLAGIITMTPGTVSAELSDDHTHLLVHSLDVDDADALVEQIKARYEAPIRELFE
jgi:multicomponent K+:H+ antiporter subunit E